MARVTFGLQLLALGLLALVRADPSASTAAATSLRGSASVEAPGPSQDEHAADAGTPQSEQSEDLLNATDAAESLIVCNGGKVCRGAWTWHGHVRECSGGFYCRRGAVLLLADGSESGEQEDEANANSTLEDFFAENSSEPDDEAMQSARADFFSEDKSETEGEAMNSSDLMKILTNTSEAAESLIVCAGGRVCRGGWFFLGGFRRCRGGFVCGGRRWGGARWGGARWGRARWGGARWGGARWGGARWR